jgi:hypothetical protein
MPILTGSAKATETVNKSALINTIISSVFIAFPPHFIELIVNSKVLKISAHE